MADFTLHWTKKIGASRHEYEHAPLQLSIETKFDRLSHQITLYLENDALTKDLVEAINSVMAKHAPAPILEAAE